MVDMSKLRVGTPVRLRNGEVYVVEKWSQDCDPEERWPFEVSFFGDKTADYYSEQGFYSGPSEPCDIDIVEILDAKEKTEDRMIDVFKIKQGDTIKFRNGEVHTVAKAKKYTELWVEQHGCFVVFDDSYYSTGQSAWDIVEHIPEQDEE